MPCSIINLWQWVVVTFSNIATEWNNVSISSALWIFSHFLPSRSIPHHSSSNQNKADNRLILMETRHSHQPTRCICYCNLSIILIVFFEFCGNLKKKNKTIFHLHSSISLEYEWHDICLCILRVNCVWVPVCNAVNLTYFNQLLFREKRY